MFENNIPEGFNKVESSRIGEVLSLSGSRSATYFFEGDTIVCSEEVFSKDFETASGDTKPIPYLGCTVNGRETMVPMAAFRRFPRNLETFIKENPSMKDFVNGSDAERYNLIKGKTIKVIKMVKGEVVDWSKTHKGESAVYKTVSIPVLKIQ